MAPKSVTVRFLTTLRNEFNDLFIVREGAPIDEFWEMHSEALEEASNNAAPELLEALVQIIEDYDDLNAGKVSRTSIAKARVAIAKARGR